MNNHLNKFLTHLKINSRFFSDNRRPKFKKDLLDTEKDEILQVNHENKRSHSVDLYERNENENVSINSSNFIQSSWKCQLCQKLNKIDSQLCTDCGSNKINVYTPIENHIQKINTENSHENDFFNFERFDFRFFFVI